MNDNPVKLRAGQLLRERAAAGERMHTVTIRVGGTRLVRIRLWLASRLIMLAGWMAYGLIELTDPRSKDTPS